MPVLRCHFANGTRQDIQAADSEAVRAIFRKSAVQLLKVKLVREKRRAA